MLFADCMAPRLHACLACCSGLEASRTNRQNQADAASVGAVPSQKSRRQRVQRFGGAILAGVSNFVHPGITLHSSRCLAGAAVAARAVMHSCRSCTAAAHAAQCSALRQRRRSCSQTSGASPNLPLSLPLSAYSRQRVQSKQCEGGRQRATESNTRAGEMTARRVVAGGGWVTKGVVAMQPLQVPASTQRGAHARTALCLLRRMAQSVRLLLRVR